MPVETGRAASDRRPSRRAWSRTLVDGHRRCDDDVRSGVQPNAEPVVTVSNEADNVIETATSPIASPLVVAWTHAARSIRKTTAT